jgi:hypothetical protein
MLTHSLFRPLLQSPNGYGQDYFTLRSTYFQGRPPKSVNMYWRRFATSSIPTEDPKAFEAWLYGRWLEKDALLEHYVRNGRFPADESGIVVESQTGAAGKEAGHPAYIETEVGLAHWLEIGQIFVVLAAFALVANVLYRAWSLIVYGSGS